MMFGKHFGVIVTDKQFLTCQEQLDVPFEHAEAATLMLAYASCARKNGDVTHCNWMVRINIPGRDRNVGAKRSMT